MGGLVKSQQRDAASLLAILHNSELLEKRLTQLRDAEAQAQAVIDLAGPAAEIVRMREQIGEEHEAIAELKVAAQEDNEAKIQAATEEAEAIVAKAQTEAEETRAKASEVMATAQSKMSEANAEAQTTSQLNRDLEAATAKADALQETLNARLLELEEERQLLTDERKKLAGVRDQIATMLG